MRRALHEHSIRTIDKWDQEIHHESWQDELESRQRTIEILLDDLSFHDKTIDDLRFHVGVLESHLADAKAEIVRLNALLDSQSKKHPHSR